MIFNSLLTGVGGEGVLLTSVVLARAASIEGYEVMGTQLHGLAQRGGSIPTHVRFGRKLYSPITPRAEADLIIGLEPVETARYCYFADKKRTNFIIDNYPIVPLMTRMQKKKYPSLEQVKKMISPFAKRTVVTDASKICTEKFGSPIYGNVMTLGVALREGMLPLKKQSILKAMKTTVPRGLEKNVKAFNLGLKK